MERRQYSRALVICMALQSGCSDPETDAGPKPVDLGGREADAGDRDLGADGGASVDAATRAGSAFVEPRIYAVVSNDYVVTSVALLEPDGEPLMLDFVSSGSATAGLVTALSGDVVLPTRSGEPTVLTLLDRFSTDVVTRIDVESGEVLGQVKTHTPNADGDDGAYSSNPHDWLYVDAHSAWVSRHGPNVAADADDPDRGNDLLHLDSTALERTGERIDLGDMGTTGMRQNVDTGETEEVAVYARPSRMARLGEHAVVGLTRASKDFDALADGVVALVDLETRQVSALELPGLRNCGHVAPVPMDDARVAVACTGSFLADPRDTAGHAILRLIDGELAIEHLWRAADDPASAVAVDGMFAVSATEVVAMEAGRFPVTGDDGEVVTEATNDVAYLVDVDTGEQTRIFEAEGQYVIGEGAFNAWRGLLMIPDASTDASSVPTAGVRRFRREDDGAIVAVDVVKVHDLLPPRQVKPL